MNDVSLEGQGKTYFVTGSTGFLGSRLVRLLCGRGGKVFCLVRSTSNLARISDLAAQITLVRTDSIHHETFFAEHPVDCVVHCATDYGRKITSPLSVIEANLILPLKLLHAASCAGVPVFINTDTVLDKRINGYSLSKHQFSQWLETYSNRIAGINVALQHFYGPGDDQTKFATHIIAALMRNDDRIALTPGEQKRDFIYIDDVVLALMKIIDKSSALGLGHHEFQVGTGNTVSIRHFVETARRISGNRQTLLDFGAIPYREGEVMDIETDLSKMRGIDWQPRYSLEDGLIKTIQEMAVVHP